MKPGDSNHDFDKALPDGKEFFSLAYLARLWECSQDTVQRLVDAGDLEVAVNIAPGKSKKSMQRIARQSVVNFLNRRRGK